MATREDQLSNDLASLRIRRDGATSRSTGHAAGRGGARGRSGRTLWLAAAAVLAVLAGGVVYERVLKASWFAPEVETSQVVLLAPDQQTSLLVSTGYVVAERQATVAPKVVGRVAQLNVDAGSVAKAGEVLAMLDRSDALAAVAQAEADAAASRAQALKARADLATAKVDAEREHELLARNAVGKAEVTDADLKMQTMQAALAAAEQQADAQDSRIQVARAQLDDLTVRAPFAGTVIKRLAQVGETVSLGNGVCVLADLGSLEVEADVSEAQLGRVHAGQPAEIQLDAFPDQRFRGVLDTVVPDVDRSKATATARVKFDVIPAGVFPDMAAKVTFLAKAMTSQALSAAPSLVVPASAVAVRDGVAELLVVGAGGRLAEAPVELGERKGDRVALKSGPPVGTKIVVAPTDALRAGTIVKEETQ